MSRTRVYQCWANMRSRCENQNDVCYPSYGGRGIKVCKRWLKFENFYKDMGDPPTASHTLDRFPDRDGDYRPGNTRWATPKQQGRNRGTNKNITHKGLTLCISAWSEKVAIPAATIGYRLRNGWSVEEALGTQVGALRRSRQVVR